MKVSIITLCWNHYDDVTKPFLEQIFKTSGIDYEVIFVDNASEDQTSEQLKKELKDKKNIKIVTSKENLGFANGNNLGLEYADGEYICFINNDVTIQDPLWLKKMVDYIDNHSDIALSPEIIVDQPAAIWNDGFVQYMNGWCIVVKKDILDKIGAFHKAFISPYLEDTEFSVRLKHFGYDFEKFDVDITHLGGRSTFDQIDMYQEGLKSRKIFIHLMTNLDKNIPIKEYLMLK